MAEAGVVGFPALVLSLLEDLASAGLASSTAQGWLLAPASNLPEPEDILRSFAADHSAATPEIVLAAQALTGLEQALRSGQPIQVRVAMQEQFEQSSITKVTGRGIGNGIEQRRALVLGQRLGQ